MTDPMNAPTVFGIITVSRILDTSGTEHQDTTRVRLTSKTDRNECMDTVDSHDPNIPHLHKHMAHIAVRSYIHADGNNTMAEDCEYELVGGLLTSRKNVIRFAWVATVKYPPTDSSDAPAQVPRLQLLTERPVEGILGPRSWGSGG